MDLGRAVIGGRRHKVPLPIEGDVENLTGMILQCPKDAAKRQVPQRAGVVGAACDVVVLVWEVVFALAVPSRQAREDWV